MTKHLFVKTYGCQMNVYDSSRMADLMQAEGYDSVDSPEQADLIILNTCHIREKASEKLYSDLGRIRRMKQKRERETGKRILVAVAGCVAQAEGDEILTRAKMVDMVVGPQSIQRLPEMVKLAEQSAHSNQVALDFLPNEKFDRLPEEQRNQGISAFVSVQEGCDKFCTFCVVPYTRGAEFSRPVSDIYRETLILASNGTREITLLGQNVNAYHGTGPDQKNWDLARLIHLLADIPDVTRIRYTTSHPRDMNDALIDTHRDVEKLMPSMHLPVQSGSDRILAAMNRKHTAEEYLQIIDRLKAARSDLAFSSDFIVGFPGETDEDFQQTMQLVRAVGYAQSYSFKYSPRPGTPAALHENQVPEEVKDERLAELQALLVQQQTEYNLSKVGQEMLVLFDRAGKHEGQLAGKTPYMQTVHVMGADTSEGALVPVKILSATGSSLTGEIIHTSTTDHHSPSLTESLRRAG